MAARLSSWSQRGHYSLLRRLATTVRYPQHRVVPAAVCGRDTDDDKRSAWLISGLVVAWTSLGAWAGTEQKEAGEFAAKPGLHPRILYSVASYQANENIEDRYDVRETAAGDVVCAVYDGHGGWQVAEFAKHEVPKNLEKEFTNMPTPFNTPQVQMALVRAFERSDRSIMYRVHAAFEMGLGNVARVGACALVALFKDRVLHVAHAGDCRAVMGVEGEGGVVTAKALTEDHNAKLPKEQAALREAHPGEADIIKCKNPNACYVKGRLQPTRALGDVYLKYSEFNGRPGFTASAGGRYIPPPYTPPYITAHPDVTSVPLDKTIEVEGVKGQGRCKFVILASDGLWDILDNETAVRVVNEAMAEGDGVHAGQRLIDLALLLKALELDVTLTELASIPVGRKRRSTHDDMTVVVVMLKEEEEVEEDESDMRKRLSQAEDTHTQRQYNQASGG